MAVLFWLAVLPSCGQQQASIEHSKAFIEMAGGNKMPGTDKNKNVRTDTATFAAGCFWCVEEQFRQLDGVLNVTSGFTGGHTVNPGYEQVSDGTTGHAEACNIIYDPGTISYDALLAAFFVAHDPTQLNRQGNDIGTQYRSAIFYHNEMQRKLAVYYIKRLNAEKIYPAPVVTEVNPFSVFYKAAADHQNYYANNKELPYCRMVIQPKRDRFRAVFKDRLKQ
ncbi:peptide-methionine (S)-S-oxide reductase MsrA [Niabella sp. CC-SYL272]|uniref:peptide-methionine (S)-S-oxide reductase MsrA n=1 Tax=Niabella agricola TaxID=2891571 RepID=UPI001F34A9A7|nr:peptide-methionine (S)-S-oxide reductase MsrA [Niabella agricola]MCF3107739.1 peptide-methionine (S)-S-oxide reductase MsrA [Niabella agricola]